MNGSHQRALPLSFPFLIFHPEATSSPEYCQAYAFSQRPFVTFTAPVPLPVVPEVQPNVFPQPFNFFPELTFLAVCVVFYFLTRPQLTGGQTGAPLSPSPTFLAV